MSTALISPEDVWDRQGLTDECFLMDVRTPAEYREVHIPGSVNTPLGQMERQLSAVQDRPSARGTAIVRHTRIRSQAVHDELERLGIRGAPILHGGLVSWIDRGLPVIRGAETISLQRQVQIGAGSLTLLGGLLGVFVSPWFLALAGLAGAGQVIAGMTDTCTFAGLLSKLPFNRRGQSQR